MSVFYVIHPASLSAVWKKTHHKCINLMKPVQGCIKRQGALLRSIMVVFCHHMWLFGSQHL